MIGLGCVWIRGDTVFNWFTVAAFDPGNKALLHNAVELHAWVANLLLALAGIHAIAAAWQHRVLKDGVLQRLLLPWALRMSQRKGISIRDKVEGTREIPATPYMLHLLATLPRRNEWVFPSNTSATGCLTEPNNPHTRACKAAGLEGLTLHGLRRSFKSLTEWLEVPVGVVAQIQGHKPSATAEKHYTIRPLELLRVHHERIEAWILEQAGIVFDAKAAPGALRVVAA